MKGSVTIKQNYEFRRLYAKGKSAVQAIAAVAYGGADKEAAR